MQNTDMSLTPVPESPRAKTAAEPARHVSDKNRIDPIARSSEPGRQGEESVYVPPSQLHPERSTAQSAFDNSLTASTSGSYGLDHFLDKGSIADSIKESTEDSRSQMLEGSGRQQADAPHGFLRQQMQSRLQTMDRSVREQPYLYALGALGAGILIGRFVTPSNR